MHHYFIMFFTTTTITLLTMLQLYGILLTLSVAEAAPNSTRQTFYQHQERQDLSYWQKIATEKILRHYNRKNRDSIVRTTVAKNVVLFIGDGMGMTTITAARILKQQQHKLKLKQEKQQHKSKKLMENIELTFDQFENVALTQTYNLDSQVGDSGACATSLMSGVKANFETVGVSGAGKLDDCSSTLTQEARVSSIADWAQQEGKSTGVVTTTRITHATPAAFYAHSANRYWESDDKVPQVYLKLCKDIARQLVEDEPGKNLNVILGGGRRHFITPIDAEAHHQQNISEHSRRRDGKNLIKTWLNDKEKRGLTSSYVSNKLELARLNTSKVDYLLGLFSSNHLAHEADRDQSDSGEPSLAEMSVKAIEVLKHNPNGFLLMVESGRIDHAHHLNNAYRALTDTLALDQAVQAVLEHVNLSNTMLIVTADHSHVFTFGGFPGRENPIFGVDNRLSDLDHMPYTTLLYANGPGYQYVRENLTNVNTGSKEYVQQAAVPRRWETHGGEDVPAYSTGVGGEVLNGVVDQTFIPYAISYAACMGPMKPLCLEHLTQNRINSARCVASSHNSIGIASDDQQQHSHSQQQTKHPQHNNPKWHDPSYNHRQQLQQESDSSLFSLFDFIQFGSSQAVPSSSVRLQTPLSSGLCSIHLIALLTSSVVVTGWFYCHHY